MFVFCKTVFYSSRYSARHELRERAKQLEKFGAITMSRWLFTDHERREFVSNAPPEDRDRWAKLNMMDVERSDVFIGFNGNGEGRGGRHAEFGAALFQCGRVIWIGQPEHLFHMHPIVERFETWELFIEYLEAGNAL